MSQEKKIVFLTYLTNYNINQINRALSYKNVDDYLEVFLKEKRESSEFVSEKFVEDIRNTSKEKYEEMKYMGIHAISRYNVNYPESLKTIPQSPPLIYYKGQIKVKTNIAIVGTRDTSQYAYSTIEKFIAGLSNNDDGVVSGLAVGIDTMAHNIALDCGIYTLAVLPNSLDHIYPKENYGLANRILDNNGALISELAIGINRGKKSFVERNRLQSGVSDYVFPVEMGIKSGTMHTVDFCIKQGKYLMVNNVNELQLKLPQYQGVKFLKTKNYNKVITLDGDLSKIDFKQKAKDLNTPTLF